MSEITLSQLPPSVRGVAVKVREAAERNDPKLAVELSWQVLAVEPTCGAVRKIQFRCQHGLLGEAKPGWGSKLGGLLASRAAGKSDPTATFAAADSLLKRNYHSEAGWTKLAAAARQAGCVDMECWAGGCRAQLNPQSKTAWTDWAETLLRRQRAHEAVKALTVARQHHPHDAALDALTQRAAVAQTVSTGGWEGEGDFRSKLRKSDG